MQRMQLKVLYSKYITCTKKLHAHKNRHQRNSFFPLAVSLLNNQPTVAYIFIFIYLSLHFSLSPLLLALLLCNISQLLYIAIPPCTYFLKLLSPLHCCTVALFVCIVLYCIVLYCIVLYILCKHTESHFTKSNSLFVQTYLANKT